MYGIPSEDNDEYYYDDEECWVMDNVEGEDCLEEADVEGMSYCWAYIEYNECTGEESCYAYVTVDGVDMEGDCDDLEEEHYDDDEWYYDDEVCVEGGEDLDCFDMVVDYIEGLESCSYFESCDECWVTAVVNGE
jgi:hypothetical protein